MHLVHLTASSFYGGPERQMLGLARALPHGWSSTFLSFAEGGRCGAFLDKVNEAGFEGIRLQNDTPHLRTSLRELTEHLELQKANVLIAHGYKSNLLGRIAARRAGIPIVSVSRGWTGENVKVRVYETLDRFNLRFMDAVVCVSDGQARKVRRASVPSKKIRVIRNAARLDAFRQPAPEGRAELRKIAGAIDGEVVIVAAGRLSPEKGFSVLVEAAAAVHRTGLSCRFVLFGGGTERATLERRITELGLSAHFVLAGFREDLDRLLPWADVVVLPSFTEGLPNVALEASAAGVPVVATAVGGTPEVICQGVTGYLVPPGDPSALAERLIELCSNEALRRRLGEAGRKYMQDHFSFEAQAQAYQRLLTELVNRPIRLSAQKVAA
jgi:glycosyltransferase involved in cell wall biosynthesis